jgi:hypothetical protein
MGESGSDCVTDLLLVRPPGVLVNSDQQWQWGAQVGQGSQDPLNELHRGAQGGVAGCSVQGRQPRTLAVRNGAFNSPCRWKETTCRGGWGTLQPNSPQVARGLNARPRAGGRKGLTQGWAVQRCSGG